MTRILLLTDNYPPEMNAAANRCSAHAERWVKTGAEVTVVTSFPNFPDGVVFSGYRQKLYQRETLNGVPVVRVPTLIFPNVGTVKRIIDYLSFMVTGALGALFARRPDALVATSPQFFTAVGGWLVCFLRRCPFVLELRDLWPDSIVAVGALQDGRLVRLIRALEGFLYRRADLIITVTEGSRAALLARGVAADKVIVVRNGAQTGQLGPGEAPALRATLGLSGKVVVSYIGTMGLAQGLGLLLEAARMVQDQAPDVAFLLVGAGAERAELEAAAQAARLTNLVFVGRVPHAEIGAYWQASDIGLALLKDEPLFRTVIPSKVFEAMATGTPLLSNVAGETEALLAPLGAAEFVAPGDAGALAAAIIALAGSPERRQAMREAGLRAAPQFDRDRGADALLAAIVTLLSQRLGGQRAQR